jgi:hypothetical protein
MKKLSTLAVLLALTSFSAFAEDKPEAKADAKPEAKADAKKDEKPAGEAKPEKPKPTPEERFKKLDKDGNGSLSLDEFRGKKEAAEAGEAFKAMDTNGDGSISLEEFLAGAQKAPKKKKKE